VVGGGGGGGGWGATRCGQRDEKKRLGSSRTQKTWRLGARGTGCKSVGSQWLSGVVCGGERRDVKGIKDAKRQADVCGGGGGDVRGLTWGQMGGV